MYSLILCVCVCVCECVLVLSLFVRGCWRRVCDNLQVLMRIVKHTQECVNAHTYSTGYILGLDIDGRLEVTEAVPLPSKHDQDDSGADDGSKAAEDKHQRDILEHLVQAVRAPETLI